MTPNPSLAALYDALHRGTPGDTAFYLAKCRDAQHVLELGSGTGRVSLALAAEGIRVAGLELDAEHIALAQERKNHLSEEARNRVRFSQGNMACFDLGETFDRVIIPYNGLYCLTDETQQRDCLASAHRHLRTGGTLLFDVYEADTFHNSAPQNSETGHSDTEPASHEWSWDEWGLIDMLDVGGRGIEVWERSGHHRGAQTLEAQYDFRCGVHGQSLARSTITQRYVLRTELEPLLASAGFDVSDICSGFDDLSPTNCWVVSAKR